MTTVKTMSNDKLSSKLAKLIKSAMAAAVLPIFIIYIMVAKPDYAIMNGLAHVVLPVANVAGQVVTWPIRAVGNGIKWIRETATIRSENEQLKRQINELLAEKHDYDTAIAENKKLEHELNIVKASPFNSVVADIQFDDKPSFLPRFIKNVV